MTVAEIVRARFFRVWLILVALAVIAPVVSVEGHAGTTAAVVVIVLAAVKVRFVGLDFMELREAPWPTRLAFEAYCAGVALVIAGSYVLL